MSNNPINKMPDWMKKQLDLVDKKIKSWSPAKQQWAENNDTKGKTLSKEESCGSCKCCKFDRHITDENHEVHTTVGWCHVNTVDKITCPIMRYDHEQCKKYKPIGYGDDVFIRGVTPVSEVKNEPFYKLSMSEEEYEALRQILMVALANRVTIIKMTGFDEDKRTTGHSLEKLLNLVIEKCLKE